MRQCVIAAALVLLTAALRAQTPPVVATDTTRLADDFVLSSTGGMSSHMPRDKWLAALPGLQTRSLVPEVVDSRSFGDVTVARVLVRWEASFGDRDMTGSYAVTDIFRQEHGGWRLAWRVSVRLPDE